MIIEVTVIQPGEILIELPFVETLSVNDLMYLLSRIITIN